MAGTGVVFTTPQVDLLSPSGKLWDLVGETVERNDVVGKLAAVKAAAEDADVPVFYSRMCLRDSEYAGWKHPSAILRAIFDARALENGGPGVEIVPELTPGPTSVLLAPRRGFSAFWQSDIDVQLRQHGVERIILAGMAANLCVESHLRDAAEHGYETHVVTDAVGAAGEEALAAAQLNFRMHASGTPTAQDACDMLRSA